MRTIHRTTGLPLAAVLATLLAACGGTDAGNGVATAAASESSVDLGPLTGAEICERLDAATVGSIIGFDVGTPKPSTSMTPQCSYPYTGSSGGAYNVTVAYQRPDGDLLGRKGAEGFDYVAQMQRGNVKANPNATETSVDAGDKAVRFSGIVNLHYGLLLTGGRVMTVTAFTDSVQPAAIDQLLGKMAEVFGR